MSENIKKKRPLMISVAIFVVVLLVTVLLYGYNWHLKKQISDLNNEIEKSNIALNELKKDKKVEVLALLESKKGIIQKLDSYSDVTKYMNHIEKIGNKYNIEFSGFDMDNGTIKTKAIANTKNNIFAYMNVKNFIKDYRNEDSQDDLVKLDFINRFEGNDTIRFDITFLLK